MEIDDSPTALTTTTEQPHTDPIIGLDVGGTLFYFHLSVLLNSGSIYFSTRFTGRFNAGIAYTDNVGRNVYFIDRSPKRFEYVRDYITTLHLHIPPNDIILRRQLREEADYFGLEGMLALLQITHVETPNHQNQGVLYWLGTRRRTCDYRNPHRIGAVHVGGWVDSRHMRTRRYFDFASAHNTRENFVGYRTPVSIDTETYLLKHVSFLMSCEHGTERLPVVVDLKFVHLRPTHYSLRASKCRGMAGDWNLEASKDGETWDVLHASRNDNNLLFDHAPGRRTSAESFLQEVMQEYVYSEKEALDAVVSFLEQHCRHTWRLDPQPTEFYQHFRIIGASEPHTTAPGVDTCLHGDGLELYGEVYEE